MRSFSIEVQIALQEAERYMVLFPTLLSAELNLNYEKLEHCKSGCVGDGFTYKKLQNLKDSIRKCKVDAEGESGMPYF